MLFLRVVWGGPGKGARSFAKGLAGTQTLRFFLATQLQTTGYRLPATSYQLRRIMMHQDEIQQANGEGEESHSGGAAPEHRQCRYLKADGKGCRDWAIRGQEFCYRHGVFVRPGAVGKIAVPLLEDEASVVLVLSETLRAVVMGTLSLKHGALLLDGCRLAHSMQMDKLRAEKLRSGERGAGSREEAAGSVTQGSERTNQGSGRRSQVSEVTERRMPVAALEAERPEEEGTCDQRPESCEGTCEEPCEEPCGRCSEPGSRCPRQFDRRCEEGRAEVLAATAELLEEQVEEEAVAVG